jgi:hypothetical protein
MTNNKRAQAETINNTWTELFTTQHYITLPERERESHHASRINFPPEQRKQLFQIAVNFPAERIRQKIKGAESMGNSSF